LIAAKRAGPGADGPAVPPTLLAIDTATEVCSVALARDGRVVECAEEVGQKHSERILPMVQSLLRQAGLSLGDCDAFAFGAGRPVIAVGNLEALALAASDEAPGARTVVAAIAARMQEAYWAVYSVGAGALVEVAAPALAAADELAAICSRYGPDLVAGNALRAFPEAAAALACAKAPQASAGAAAIARLAVGRFERGGAVPAEQAAPVYVRDRVALTIDERRSLAGAGNR
jgi:tRNA threonylcarbamoyladenosine biosynthesis protein TsaB